MDHTQVVRTGSLNWLQQRVAPYTQLTQLNQNVIHCFGITGVFSGADSGSPLAHGEAA